MSSWATPERLLELLTGVWILQGYSRSNRLTDPPDTYSLAAVRRLSRGSTGRPGAGAAGGRHCSGINPCNRRGGWRRRCSSP